MERNLALLFQAVLQHGQEALHLLAEGRQELELEQAEQVLSRREAVLGELLRVSGAGLVELPSPVEAQAVARQNTLLEAAVQQQLDRLQLALNEVRSQRGSLRGVRTLLASGSQSSLLDTRR